MSTTNTNPDDDRRSTDGDVHTDVAAAQENADAEPVTDERDAPAPDEDRNP